MTISASTTADSPAPSGVTEPGLSVPKPRFRSDIEGVRAIAILLVVGYHAHVPGFRGGFVGVDVFFVLSGYLITWLLVHEAEKTGTLNLREFYARRARRLLPAMAVVLLAVIAVATVINAPFEQVEFAKSAAFTAAYLSNAFFAATATNYLGAPPETNPLLHTWSLSVEEQFYLVWPLFVLFACGVWGGQFRLRRLLGWMAGVTVASFAASWWLTATHQPLAFFSSPTRAWEFAAGALGVLIPVRAGRSGALRTALGGAGLVALLAVAIGFGPATPFPGVAALLPVGATIVVLRAGTAGERTALSRVLALRPLQEIGRLSYSWYLWHWPVLVFAGVLFPGLMPIWMRLGLLVLALVLAETSYRLIEDPVRHNARLSAHPHRSLLFAIVLTLAIGAVSVGWHQAAKSWSVSPEQVKFLAMKNDVPKEINNALCEPGFEGTVPNECTFGPDEANHTIVLVGDSHAAQWFSALKPLTQDGWRLVVMSKGGCPIVNAYFYNKYIGRRYTECEQWRDAVVDKVKDISPDITVVGTFVGTDFTQAQWREGTVSAFGSLSMSSKQVFLIEDTPVAEFDFPVCLARRAWRSRLIPSQSCQFRFEPQANAFQRQSIRAASKMYTNIHMVDMNDIICPNGLCQGFVGGVGVFRDMHHITDALARALSPDFLAVLRNLPENALAE